MNPEDTETEAAQPAGEGIVELPYSEIEPATLRNIIEDLVTRDGTDYGAVEKTLDEKASALLRQLESGAARLIVDLATETLSVISAEELARARSSGADVS